jgi:hypothetical protein
MIIATSKPALRYILMGKTYRESIQEMAMKSRQASAYFVEGSKIIIKLD